MKNPRATQRAVQIARAVASARVCTSGASLWAMVPCAVNSRAGGGENQGGDKKRQKRDTSTARCYECQQFGHIAKMCPVKKTDPYMS